MDRISVCLQDQKQYFRVNSGKPYWYNPSKSHFVIAAEFAELFRTSHLGQASHKRLTRDFDPRQQASNVSYSYFKSGCLPGVIIVQNRVFCLCYNLQLAVRPICIFRRGQLRSLLK